MLRPPPTLGQHIAEVLVELGYTRDEIAAMRESGAVGGSTSSEGRGAYNAEYVLGVSKRLKAPEIQNAIWVIRPLLHHY